MPKVANAEDRTISEATEMINEQAQTIKGLAARIEPLEQVNQDYEKEIHDLRAKLQAAEAKDRDKRIRNEIQDATDEYIDAFRRRFVQRLRIGINGGDPFDLILVMDAFEAARADLARSDHDVDQEVKQLMSRWGDE